MLKFETEVKEETPRSRDVASSTVAPATSFSPSSYTNDTHQVRPDELADALSALEQKKRKAFTATIPLEQTLAQMNVDATEQEVWNEIQQRRLQWQKERVAPAKKKHTPREELILGFAATFAMIIAALFIMSLVFPQQTGEVVAKISGEIAIKTRKIKTTPIGPSVTGVGDYGYTDPHSGLPDMVVQTPTMKRLSEIKDGEVLTLNLFDAYKLQKQEILGATMPERLKDIFVETNPNPYNPQFVRYNHQWYLRGWTTQKPLTVHNNHTHQTLQLVPYVPQAMQEVYGVNPAGKYVTLADKKTSLGLADKQVQIPIKIIPGTSAGDDKRATFVPVASGEYDLVTMEIENGSPYGVPSVDIKHLDSHAWDKWEPRKTDTE